MSRVRLKLGHSGEQLAQNFLKTRGMQILRTNLHLLSGEIDIVAQDRGTVVLVEVKTKTATLQGAPWEMITRRKQKTLVRLAQELGWQYPDRPIRIDALGILQASSQAAPQITYVPNAVEGR